jgi:hypothetical protein
MGIERLSEMRLPAGVVKHLLAPPMGRCVQESDRSGPGTAYRFELRKFAWSQESARRKSKSWFLFSAFSAFSAFFAV